MEKPTLPKGTRDFGPSVMAKRQFILESIKSVFQKYGFLPLETPAMENLSTLTGKYGEEGDQLLFKVLDSGEFFKNVQNDNRLVERRHQFMRGLQLVLENICDRVFRKYEERETRNWGHIKELIESEELDKAFVGVPLDTTLRYQLKNFIQRESLITSINLVQFFIDADIYKNEDFHQKLSHHFQQFIDKVIIKGYSKILEDYLIANLSSKEVASRISEKGLRYDLTVPFARYVVMNRNEIAFPFKRYQIQPVWRADKPQRGRYREFYQCDADVVGSDSLINEAELLCIYREAFHRLGMPQTVVKINNRKVLQGIAEYCGAGDKIEDITRAIDKIDKIGRAGVENELAERGLSINQVQKIMYLIEFKGNIYELNFDPTTPLDDFEKDFLSNNIDVGVKGIQELKHVLSYHANLASEEWSNSRIEIDFTLARGLNYYTGIIVEVVTNSVKIGSIGGGGRYDNLTQAFGSKEKLSGVGISFGVDRIYDVLEELDLFRKETQLSSKILICPLDKNSIEFGLRVLAALRRAEISSEIFPDPPKEKKPQEKPLLYAEKKLIPYIVLVNSDGMLTLKELKNKGQENLSIEQIIQKLNS